MYRILSEALCSFPLCRQLIMIIELYSHYDVYDYLREIALTLCSDKVSEVRWISYKLVSSLFFLFFFLNLPPWMILMMIGGGQLWQLVTDSQVSRNSGNFRGNESLEWKCSCVACDR